jgi:hypothetical protein
MGSDLLGNTPIAVVLAVLESVMTLEKGLGHINGSNFTAAPAPKGRG